LLPGFDAGDAFHITKNNDTHDAPSFKLFGYAQDFVWREARTEASSRPYAPLLTTDILFYVQKSYAHRVSFALNTIFSFGLPFFWGVYAPYSV
jgi:hypothetical protein